MKLGKNEKKVLVLLLKPNENKYPENGKSISLIAEDVYPNKQVKEKIPNNMYEYNLLASPTVSLTNTFNSLFKKELVIKAKPQYSYIWESSDDIEEGHMYKKLRGLYNYKYGDNKRTFITVKNFLKLPYKTKLWWILTDKGRELAKKLTSKNPELDKLSGFYYKNKIEEQRRKLIKRCSRCWNFDHEEMYCKEEEMKGIEYEIEDCKYHNSIDKNVVNYEI